MAIDVNDSNYAFGAKVPYRTVNGVKYAIVRADAWFDRIGAANAPAPRGKSLSAPLRDGIKGRRRFNCAKTVKLALNPDPAAYHAAVHRATYYPADQVTFTTVSRKKPRPGSSARNKAGRAGRGKVGVGGMRTRSHS
jgi:hypothetical protein